MGDGLNRAQRSAVTTMGGPLLVLAGAGTGKTRVITFRIAELIKHGVQPQRILAVTFTNKAAREMRERAMGLLKGPGRRKKKTKGPEISTFHSLCVRVLRRHIQRLGYPENFTIYDRGDQETIARNALRDIRVGHEKLRPSDLINIISGWKSQSVRPHEAEHVAEGDQQILAALAYARYQAALKAAGAVDFDDLLLLTEELFVQHPESRYAEASRFDHLLIDEYQDTNGLQYRIVKHLAERHKNLCVVGDDDQSIYGWRGAEVEHILSFAKDWPEAKVVRLEENYRSSGWVIHLANTLIRHNSMRHDKVLRSTRGQGPPPRFLRFEEENAEAENIAREIEYMIHREDEERVPASDIAILFRTNEQPRVFEAELRRAGVPYTLVGGQSFYDRKEIKDLVSYLRILANPSDEVSLLRIINTPARGIGTGSVQTLLDDAVSRGEPLWKLLPTALEHPDISQGASQAIEDFRLMIEEFRARVGREPLTDLFRELLARIDYRSEIVRQYKAEADQEARWNAVQELVNAIATYESRDENPSLLGFLEETSLTTRDDQKDSDDKRQEHAITLMTLHSAKGLEFPKVYLVGLEEGLLPHKRSVVLGGNHIDEERRLAYVGVTRAQDELTLSFCKNRMKWGKLRAQIPSRFLLEMRGETAKAEAIAAEAQEEITRLMRVEEGREEEATAKRNKRRKGSRKSASGASEKPARRSARSETPSATDAKAPSSSATSPAASTPPTGPSVRPPTTASSAPTAPASRSTPPSTVSTAPPAASPVAPPPAGDSAPPAVPTVAAPPPLPTSASSEPGAPPPRPRLQRSEPMLPIGSQMTPLTPPPPSPSAAASPPTSTASPPTSTAKPDGAEPKRRKPPVQQPRTTTQSLEGSSRAVKEGNDTLKTGPSAETTSSAPPVQGASSTARAPRVAKKASEDSSSTTAGAPSAARKPPPGSEQALSGSSSRAQGAQTPPATSPKSESPESRTSADYRQVSLFGD